jgi:ubiquinone/menaquinone biosynthesis C-methylase UbiE
MTFEEQLTTRSAAVYADFLMPHLRSDTMLIDVGCGQGSISVGLAPQVGRVMGIDVEDEDFVGARAYAVEHGLDNVEFRVGSVYELGVPDASFDACLAHSLMEALDRPLDALREIHRALQPGGVVGVASVEYGGLILAGVHEPLLRRFYEIRERLWLLDGADPHLGRTLRGLLDAAGFERIDAVTTSMSYGTAESVRSFGLGRAADCRDEWYSSQATAYALATAEDLSEMERAWTEWSESADAYASFSWCRAIGFKPGA